MTKKLLPALVTILVVFLILDALFVVLYTSSPRSVSAGQGGLQIVINNALVAAAATDTPVATVRQAAVRQAAANTPDVVRPTSTAIKVGEIAIPTVAKRVPASTSSLPMLTPTPTPIPAQPVRAPLASAAMAEAAEAEAAIHPQPATSCPNPVGLVFTEMIRSKVTVVPITVHVYVPPCYNPNEYSYPTLYLIHGTAFEQGGWLYDGVPRVADMQMSLGVLPPFIIVMPGADMRAGNASTYAWSNWGKGSYEDFFMNELVPFIERKYSTWGTRDGRAIGGISRGGYWSIEIGFANPDKFSAVGGHSPSVGTMLVNMPPNFSMLDTAKSIPELHALRIWLDAGDRDWARVDAKKLSDELEEQNVDHSLDIGEGSHEDGYWTARVPEYLAFYSSAWPRTARARQAIGSASAANGAP